VWRDPTRPRDSAGPRQRRNATAPDRDREERNSAGPPQRRTQQRRTATEKNATAPDRDRRNATAPDRDREERNTERAETHTKHTAVLERAHSASKQIPDPGLRIPDPDPRIQRRSRTRLSSLVLKRSIQTQVTGEPGLDAASHTKRDRKWLQIGTDQITSIGFVAVASSC